MPVRRASTLTAPTLDTPDLTALTMTAKSPLPKRIRLDPSASPSPSPASDASQTGTKTNKRAAGTRSSSILERDSAHDHPLDEIDVVVDEDEDHCVICLHRVLDRTVLPCAHDRLCFDCIFVWCQQSRKCPLCNAPIGPFLIHNLRSKYDYSKYYLPPLRISSPTSIPVPETLSGRYATTRVSLPPLIFNNITVYVCIYFFLS